MSDTLSPRIWEHTFLQGEDEARLRELRNAAEALAPKKKDTPDPNALLTDGEPVDPDRQEKYEAAVQAADDFAAEAEPRGVKVKLQAISRTAWKELKAKHPGREGDPADKAAGGVNTLTLPEELVPLTLVEPDLSASKLTAFLDSLTDAQFELLALAAWQLHTSLGADPKERLRS